MKSMRKKYIFAIVFLCLSVFSLCLCSASYQYFFVSVLFGTISFLIFRSIRRLKNTKIDVSNISSAADLKNNNSFWSKAVPIVLIIASVLGIIIPSPSQKLPSNNPVSSGYFASSINEEQAGTTSACNHEWIEATCISPQKCKLCGAETGTTVSHSFNAASCTEDKVCSVCGYTEKAVGHIWADATCTSPKTCSVCGETDGKKLNHTWVDASCTTPKTCKICNAISGEALGHDWTNATCISPKTCKRCAKTKGEKAEHNWSNATCTSPKTCKVCGKTTGEKAEHNWSDATCTSPKTCIICGKESGFALGHTTNDGVCSRCGKTFYTETVPSESHTVYVTRTGKRYHYDPHCNGGTYYESTLEAALAKGLTPCNKCVHD